MKYRSLGLAIVLFSYTFILGQQRDPQDRGPQGQEQQQSQEQQQEQQPPRRPTLGPPTEPSLNGPRTSTTTDARKLLRIQKIFFEPIDNFLNEKLMANLSKMARFRIVTQRNEADAVIHGTCFDSRRLKQLHSEVFINERTSGAAIWQDVVRRPLNPPPLARAVDDTAAQIVGHLSESIREAERK